MCSHQANKFQTKGPAKEAGASSKEESGLKSYYPIEKADGVWASVSGRSPALFFKQKGGRE